MENKNIAEQKKKYGPFSAHHKCFSCPRVQTYFADIIIASVNLTESLDVQKKLWRTVARILLLKIPEFFLYAYVFLFPILVRRC